MTDIVDDVDDYTYKYLSLKETPGNSVYVSLQLVPTGSIDQHWFR